MEIIFYNAYLLITKDKNVNFGITKLQTNNTFNVEKKTFINKKQAKIIKAKLKT